jgi:outer membrane protein OmpA-like peptidoglycan-associated protein
MQDSARDGLAAIYQKRRLLQFMVKSVQLESVMPKEPIDPAEQSIGDGFQKLVQRKKKTPPGVWVIVGLAIFFAVVAFGIAGFIVFQSILEKRHAANASPAVASVTPSASAQVGSTVPAAETPKKTETPKAEATGSASAQNSPPVKSDAKEEEEDTRKEVLTRVDLMHNLSNKEKDELYAQIERARGFTKIALIPFQSARTAPGSAQIEDLVKRIQDPEVQKLLSDPTVALIFVGYADTQGDQASNLEISRTRAESVQKMVSTRLKPANLMHSVGMGGQELFDKTNREKNRVVEVWAVQP